MRAFISRNDGSRAASPVPNRSHQRATLSEEDRRRRAAAAKVDIPNTNVNGSQYDSDEQSLRQGMKRPPQPATGRAQTARQPQAPAHRYDDFDTDPENADATTITNFSNIFEQDKIYAQGGRRSEEDQESFNGDESQFAEDEESEDDQTSHHAQQPNIFPGDHMAFLSEAARQAGDPFAPSQSYPTTTHPDEEEPEDSFDDHGQEALHPEPPEVRTRGHWPPPASAARDPMIELRQKAPVHRLRSDTNLPFRKGAVETEPVRPQSVASVQHVQQRHQSRMNSLPTAQRRPARQTPRHSPTPSNAETINERNFFGASAQQYPLTPSEASSELRLDYEHEALFKMKYDDLHKESFDFVPRKDDAKQPLAHLKDSSLEDRMKVAFKELRPEEQVHFFAALDMEEWEEAGDWFLSQFGDLLKRFKDARKKKRNVARDFEDEIRERNDAVSRKRQCVEDHIVEMKGRGQRLLPETPSRKARRAAAATPH